jgi:pimeloyl-ACP methyl ester carboxylesterase
MDASMKIIRTLTGWTLACGLSLPAAAQPRSMAQDPSLDNLRHPPGTITAASNTLGRVTTVGKGPRRMVLIPGIGFGDGVWTEFMDRHKADATMYAVSLPGFGGTAPLAMPPAGSRVADAPWTRSAIAAIAALIDREQLHRVTLVAHWGLATQIALQLALDRPERVEAVVLIAGVLKSYYESPPGMLAWTAAQRAGYAEGLAQKWFRTVTRTTWDDNNFMSYDYAIRPRRGLFLWREAQAPALPVWIHYLLEFYTFDQSARLSDLRMPTLVVQPGFDDPGFQPEPGWNYMRNLCFDSWKGTAGVNPHLEFVTIPQSRLFVMFDQPEALDRALAHFFARLGTRDVQRPGTG